MLHYILTDLKLLVKCLEVIDAIDWITPSNYWKELQ